MIVLLRLCAVYSSSEILTIFSVSCTQFPFIDPEKIPVNFCFTIYLILQFLY